MATRRMWKDLLMSAVPSRYPNEVELAGRENLDAEHVQRYDSKMDADSDAEVALLRTLGLGEESTVTEFGSGTGQVSLAAAATGARVTAVDVSLPMLTYLDAKMAERGLTNVTLVHQGFLSYSPTGDAVDFLYSRYALHHLPDFWKAIALNRLRRLLKPGGVFRLWDVVYDFSPQEADQRLEAWCAQGGSSVDGEWSRAEFEEHVRDEYSTFRWILEPLIRRADFDIADVQVTPDTFDAKYVLRAV